MDQFVDLLSAGVGWIVTGNLTYRAMRQKNAAASTPPSMFRGLWLLSLFLSLYFTLRVPPIAINIDALFPWHNTARLLAYICVGWAAWFLNLTVYRIAGKEFSHRIRLLPVAMSGLLLVFFPFSLALSPSTGDEVPATFLDLCFRQILYVYMIVLLASSFALFRTLQSRENTALVRLRLILSQLSILAAITLAIVKIASSLLGYFTPETPALGYLEFAGSLFKAALVLPWLAVYLPIQMTVPLLYIWRSLLTLWLLQNVRVVEDQVRRFCTPLAAETPTFWQTLRRPEYYASRSLIHIMDARKQLSSHSEPEVIRLRQRLDGVDDTMGIPELLSFYAQIGRQMRKEGIQSVSSSQEASA